MLDRRANPRTHYIHRISYSTQERIVGSFVLLAIGLLMWLLLSSGVNSSLFEDHLTIYGELQANKAVNKDTDVSISGISVGTVTAVEITDQNEIVLSMKILKKYHNLLRTDSVARLSSFDFAVLGKSFIDITPGSAQLPLLVDGSTIRIEESMNLDSIVEQIGPIVEDLQQTLQKANQVLSAIDPTAVEETVGNMRSASRNLDDISTTITTGEGFANTAIYDPTFQKDIRVTLENMQQASVKMNQLLDTLNEHAELVPELVNRVGPLLNEADRTIKATQRIWPLSTAVGDEPEKQTLTSPEPADD